MTFDRPTLLKGLSCQSPLIFVKAHADSCDFFADPRKDRDKVFVVPPRLFHCVDESDEVIVVVDPTLAEGLAERFEKFLFPMNEIARSVVTGV